MTKHIKFYRDLFLGWSYSSLTLALLPEKYLPCGYLQERKLIIAAISSLWRHIAFSRIYLCIYTKLRHTVRFARQELFHVFILLCTRHSFSYFLYHMTSRYILDFSYICLQHILYTLYWSFTLMAHQRQEIIAFCNGNLPSSRSLTL